jgi:hypothetical protein
MKPNFLVIGAMKCATTSLCDILSQHPQIFVCSPKEPAFFSDDSVFARGWPWYESLFAVASDMIAVGEGSTGYTKIMIHPHTAERMAKHLPDAKLIYIARHPLKRIESHWLELIAIGLDLPPFVEALKSWPNIVDTSLYWKQINAYRRFYPDERILVLFFEDFVAEPYGVLKRCYQFLGVDPGANRADPATASNVSANRRLDGRVIPILRRIPGARVAKNLAPGLVLRVIEKLRHPLPNRPEWPPEIRRELVMQLADDTQEFLRFYGKAADFWSLQ